MTEDKRNSTVTGTTQEEKLLGQQTGLKKNSHRYTKPPGLTDIINTCRKQLSKHYKSLLLKVFKFLPTPKQDHQAHLLQNYLLFERKIRLKDFFMTSKRRKQTQKKIIGATYSTPADVGPHGTPMTIKWNLIEPSACIT